MVKYLQISLILLCMVSLVSGCASVTDRPLPFQNYCGFCDSKIPEPVEPAPPLPEPKPVEPAPPLPEPKPVVEEPCPVPEPVCEKIVLRGINFDFDKSNIKSEFIPVLDEAVEILKTNCDCGINVIIEGHTCWMGTAKYNQGLSERRAVSVCNYLVEKGVPQNMLKTIGYGETMPIADNHTLEGRHMNRRVVFKILD
jgi:outer membrane protein OmpA-like peptidoglycan-associated protein